MKAGKTHDGKQQYKCKKCNHRFIQWKPNHRMRHPLNIVATAIYMHQQYLSLRKVRDYLRGKKVFVTYMTIKYWIEKFGPIMKEFVSSFKYEFSGLWHFDEVVFKWKIRDKKNKHRVIEDKAYYCWNAMDAESRFMIYPEYSDVRDSEYAKKVTNRFLSFAKNPPQQVVTDSFSGYNLAFKDTLFRANPRLEHTRFVMIRGEHGNNVQERANQTLRDRTRLFKGFRPIKNSKKTADMIFTFINFIRPHTSLNGKTPAEVAGVDLKLKHDETGFLKLITLSLNYVHKMFLKEKKDIFSANPH